MECEMSNVQEVEKKHNFYSREKKLQSLGVIALSDQLKSIDGNCIYIGYQPLTKQPVCHPERIPKSSITPKYIQKNINKTDYKAPGITY
jgi:hypothetical protein